MKYLIINADDFGMSQVYNEVILYLIKKNKISSTTVIVNRFTKNQKSQIDELVSLSKKMNLSVGLHLEFENENYQAQIKHQFQKFRKLLGFSPSHIDIHKAHSFEGSIPVVAGFCKENNIPMRNMGQPQSGIKTTSTEAFFGSIKSFEGIEKWIKALKDEEYYEIMFHPGKFDPDCKSSLNKGRERDVKHIIKLSSILKENNIKSVSYLDLAASFSQQPKSLNSII